MSSSTMHRGLVGAVAFTFAATAAAADGEWRSAAHDGRRTATATGLSDIEQPAIYWRHFAGGAPQPSYFLYQDVDADGTPDLVANVGGFISAYSEGRTLPKWTSARVPLNTELYTAVDVNGDGKLEILIVDRQLLALLDGATGERVWQSEMNWAAGNGSVRVADFDGDALPDIYVHQCVCCGVPSLHEGGVFSFKSSLSNPNLLWESPPVSCRSSESNLIFDADGDGVPEFASATENSHRLLDAKTGRQIAESPVLGEAMGALSCLAADLDGSPGQELLCRYNSSDVAPELGHRLIALQFNAARASFDVLWDRRIGEKNRGVRFGVSPVTDLNADGRLEVTLEGRLVDDTRVTYVLDARSGSPSATLPGATLLGVWQSPTGPRIVTTDASGTQLYQYAAADAALRLQISLPQRWALQDTIRDTLIPAAPPARFLTLSTGAQSALVVRDAAARALETWLPSTGVSALNSYALAAGENYVEASALSTRRLAVGTSSGFVHFLDAKLKRAEEDIALGAYFASGSLSDTNIVPVIGRLTRTEVNDLAIPNSANQIALLDAKDASFAFPPRGIRNVSDADNPAFVRWNGANAFACVLHETTASGVPIEYLKLSDASGAEHWQVPLDPNLKANISVGDLNGDGSSDFIAETKPDSSQDYFLTAIDGVTGARLWQHHAGSLASIQPRAATLADYDANGTDDVWFQFDETRVLDGSSGAVLASAQTQQSYARVTPIDLDGDAQPEAFLHAGNYPWTLLSQDLSQTLWQAPNPGGARLGAVLLCPDASQRVVEADYQESGLVHSFSLGSSALVSAQSFVLAGGKLWPDAASAAAAGETPVQLASVSGHNNLNGVKTPRAVVGGADGWLYGLDPCAGGLNFSKQFPGSIGTVIFGDTDGDGLDEVLVSVSDGYIYALRNSTLPAPAWVRETAGECDGTAAGAPNADIDTQCSTDGVDVIWADVSGALAYEIALGDAKHQPVLAETWRRVGATTHAHLNVSLSPGQEYFVAVRALSDVAVSPDTLSDGFVVSAAKDCAPVEPTKPPKPAKPTSGHPAKPAPRWPTHCNVNTPFAQTSNPTLLTLFLAVAAAAILRRRSFTQ